MKRIRLLPTVLFATTLMVFFASSVPAKSNITFGFKLGGGINYAAFTDYNHYVNDWNDWLANDAVNPSGSFENFHLLTNLSGEFLLYLTPSIRIGLGMGFMSGRVDHPMVNYTNLPPPWGFAYTTDQDIRLSVIPVELTFHYTTPVTDFMNFFFYAGLGYYMGSVEWNDNGSAWLVGTYTLEAEASMNTVGIHGGIGLEFEFSPHILFFVEMSGIYAQFSEITGDYSYSSTLFGSVEEQRTLYHYLFTIYNTTQLVWRTDPPYGGYNSDVREAAFDLTGVYIGGGFILRFGGK